LSRVREVLERRGRRLKALVVFGSSVYSPRRARDVDLLVVVDALADPSEKLSIELEVSRSLRGALPRPADVTVLDVESLGENLEPGLVGSGLAAGYKVVYDELGVEGLVRGALEKLAEQDYVVVKGGRRLNLSAVARAKLAMSRAQR